MLPRTLEVALSIFRSPVGWWGYKTGDLSAGGHEEYPKADAGHRETLALAEPRAYTERTSGPRRKSATDLGHSARCVRKARPWAQVIGAEGGTRTPTVMRPPASQAANLTLLNTTDHDGTLLPGFGPDASRRQTNISNAADSGHRADTEPTKRRARTRPFPVSSFSK